MAGEVKKPQEVLESAPRQDPDEQLGSFTALADTVAAAVFIFRGDSIVFVNRRAVAITGYSSEELLNNPFWYVVHPDFQPLVRSRGKARQKGEKIPEEYELKIKTKSGEDKWVSFSAKVIQYKNEPAVLGTAVDVTAEKNYAATLSSKEEQYRWLTENSTDVLTHLERDGTITFISPACENLLEYKPDELLGRSIFEKIYKRDLVELRPLFDKLQKTGDVRTVCCRIRKKSGTLTWFESTVKLFEQPECGGSPGIIATSRDISGRKLADETLFKISKLESLSVLAGGIAHDFNNFLTAITTHIAIAKLECSPDSTIYQILTEAERAAYEVRGLTNQLVTFAGSDMPEKSQVSVNTFLRSTVRFASRGTNAKCIFELPDGLWDVEINQGQINQVINNLVINAAQAMPHGGIIEFKAANIESGVDKRLPLPHSRYVKITISDEGHGVSRKILSKIFDPYFTTKSSGNGLGLATSYAIVKNHYGLIECESDVGHGTSFHIYLPAKEPKSQPRGERSASKSKDATSYRILVLDDEPQVRNGIGIMLKHLGHKVELADKGSKAVAAYREGLENGQRFDLVILDLTIPGGMGATDVLNAIREMDGEARAVVASGYSYKPELQDFEKYGFVDRMQKPFRMNDLSEMLERHLSAPEGSL